jgi:hypothetical protein
MQVPATVGFRLDRVSQLSIVMEAQVLASRQFTQFRVLKPQKIKKPGITPGSSGHILDFRAAF